MAGRKGQSGGGGFRPGAGRPRKSPPSIPLPAATPPSAPTSVTREQLLAKLNELALEGDAACLRLALIELPKIVLIEEQTLNLKLRNAQLRQELDKAGLDLEDADEYEPSQSPVARPNLKAVGEK